MKKMIINENQKGFLFKNGKYMKLLDAGKYHLFGGKEIDISNLDQPIACSKCALETLLADKAVADRVTVVEVSIAITSAPVQNDTPAIARRSARIGSRTG